MPIPDHLRQHHLFAGGRFGLMSGEKPTHKSIVEPTHENLVRILRSMNLKHDETHGKYEQPERSVIVYGPTREQMTKLGKLFGQDSVVHSEAGQHKLVYTNGPHEGKERGTTMHGDPMEFFTSPPDDFHTHLPGHGYFRINFDWDQQPKGPDVIPMASAAAAPAKRKPAMDPGVRSPIMKRKKLAKAWPTDKENEDGAVAHDVAMSQHTGAALASPRPVHAKEAFIPAHRKLLAATHADGEQDRIASVMQTADFANAHEMRAKLQPPISRDAPYGSRLDESYEPVADPANGKKTGLLPDPYWASIHAASVIPHPLAYPWHDDDLPTWSKEDAYARARKLGLVKADAPQNDQAAGQGVSTYAKFAAPYGNIKGSSQPSDLMHYNYHGKLPHIENLVKNHGFKTYYAGGKYGKPDLVNKNYNNGHLMIYDPSTGSGGDFKHEEYTKGWRQIHELAHALTYPELNSIYGEGRRMGKLGIHRNLNEAMRAVHWEWLAAHKQRDLGEKIGVHVPDDVFHKELNTVMHDALHRAVTGKFTEPAGEGFMPHGHKVPLSNAMDVLRDEAQRMGLQSAQHTLKPAAIAKHEKREELLDKAFPKGQAGYRTLIATTNNQHEAETHGLTQQGRGFEHGSPFLSDQDPSRVSRENNYWAHVGAAAGINRSPIMKRRKLTKTEPLEKGYKCAFYHYGEKKVFPVGPIHDYDRLPKRLGEPAVWDSGDHPDAKYLNGHSNNVVRPGFVDDRGRFFTRQSLSAMRRDPLWTTSDEIKKSEVLEKRSKNVRAHLNSTTEEQRVARTKAFLPKVGIHVRPHDREDNNGYSPIKESPAWVNPEKRGVSVQETGKTQEAPPALHEAGHALTASYGTSIAHHQKLIGEVNTPISSDEKIDEGEATKMGMNLARRAGVPPKIADRFGKRILAVANGYDPVDKAKVPRKMDMQYGADLADGRTQLLDQGLAGIENGRVKRIGTGEDYHQSSGYVGYRSLKNIHAKINARAMGFGPKPKKP